MNKINNSINCIQPYRKNGMWMFDDERTGLIEELFVSGADVICEMLHQFLCQKHQKVFPRKFNLIFSDRTFPADVVFHASILKGESNENGTFYEIDLTPFGVSDKIQFWLCPALFKYFAVAPDNLYFTVKPIE